MKTYRFHFNTQYAVDLRNAVNDRQKQSLENVHEEKQIKGPYFAWDRTCAAMDRLEDTLHYLNELELGKNKDIRSAFDFYDFINNTYIVIDCIRTIGRIFRVDNKLIEDIEKSNTPVVIPETELSVLMPQIEDGMGEVVTKPPCPHTWHHNK